MVCKSTVKNFTKNQIDKLGTMWHKDGTPPQTDAEWTEYLISIQTNTLSKRTFPDVDDIYSLQLNRHFYWLVRLAITINSQERLKEAFVFYTKLRKARSDYKNEIKNLSTKKIYDIKKGVSNGN
jgi:hypothetical protein